MQLLKFQPFDKTDLIESLKRELPHYVLQKSLGGNLQVRKSRFTLTGNVKLDINAKKGIVKTQTNLDMVAVFFLLGIILGVYILAKAKQQKAMEHEVGEAISRILG